MDKGEYIRCRQQLRFDRPLWPALAVIGFDAGLAATAFWGMSLGGTAAWLAAQPLLTLVYFHNFALLHEAGHGSVHERRRVNTLIGHYASICCFMPYFPWKLMHQEHHIWAGNIEKDPTMANLKKMRDRGRVSPLVRFAWRSWVPLAALLQHFVFWGYPLHLWKTGKLNRGNLAQSLISIGFLAATYTALGLLFPAQISLSALWPSLLLYLVVTELVNLPHHVMMPTFMTTPARNRLHAWEQHVTTRSCYYPYGLAFLTLNFNLHIEHHFFPSLPWYRLPRLRALLKPALGEGYTEVIGIGWNLQNRSRDAGDIVLPQIPHPLLTA